MNKPTIFFSHATKDKAIIGIIKNRIDTITGGTIDIFMSSDGQSIPLGRNWIHKVEEGLNDAEIMFVFVTPNSIGSNWIYFEAGYAYAKGIRVIPVGIGIQIELLKPPLNLLQGFNIISSDSLNNIVSVINDSFDCHFQDGFTEDDYLSLVNSENLICPVFDFERYFRGVSYSFEGAYREREGRIIYDMEQCFRQVIEYLKENKISYSQDNTSDIKNLLVPGMKFSYRRMKNREDSVLSQRPDEMCVTFSLYNFEKTFSLFENIMTFFPCSNWIHLRFYLKKRYRYILSQEKMAAIFSDLSDDFEFDDFQVGTYRYLKSEYLTFTIDYRGSELEKEFVLCLSFLPQKANYKAIVDCLNLLIKNHVIYQKERTDE